VDPKLFLGTAHFLQNNGLDQAAYRSAISRAYYACFLEARRIVFGNCASNVLRRDNIYKQNDIGHKQLQSFLKNSSTSNIKLLGVDLAGLCKSREDADYEMSGETTEEDAQNEIDEADIFLENLSKTQPTEIGKAVEDYISRICQTRKQ
jgi:uncharacterized protein (UPF0332 family)